jgi:predicted RNA-binding Zn-ribbon protein involved in translation (DUF1610 family)
MPMPKPTVSAQTCPKCGSPKTQTIGRSPSAPAALSPPIAYVRCQACGFMSVVPQVKQVKRVSS